MIMKAQTLQRPREAPHDLSLPGGCPLCGGDLELRLGEGASGSYCPTCRWVSHPVVRHENGQVTVIHPVGGVA